MRGALGLTLLILAALNSVDAPAATHDTRLLRRPTVSQNEVAFAYAGDLWIVGRSGGKARRLTATPGVETDPRFSPDGSLIAFTATVRGNTDVYVISSNGGNPRRLTYHPGLDLVRGWTRDGRRVVFGSSRGVLPTPHTSSYVRLWTAGSEGGAPEMLPMPRAYTGSFSPDGQRIAYEEFSTEFETKEGQLQSAQWRHYRGGRTHPIRVMTLANHSESKLPWQDSNDSDPMWVGDTIYFVSDRNFTANLFAWHAGNGRLEQLTHHDDFDVMNAGAGPGAIVYEQAGFIHLLDTNSGKARRLRIQVDGDFPWALPETRDVSEMVREGAVSPDGSQVAFAARGEIFISSIAQQSVHNLTNSPAVHDRDPAWSADGSQLAWLSDVSGEYQLVIADSSTRERPRAIDLPLKAYFSRPIWSPDGRYILLSDNHLALWMIERSSGRATRIDADTYDDPERRIDPVWSPDARWIAYSRNLQNHLRAIFLYSLQENKAYRLTDSKVDAISPAFDRAGQSLYFLVSTDYGKNVEWPGMSSLERPVTRSVYAAAWSAAGAGPIVALDIAAGDYSGLIAGPSGTLFYAEYEKSGVQRMLAPKSVSVQRYRVSTQQRETFVRGVDMYAVAATGSSLLYRRAADHKWAMAAVGRASDGEDLDIDSSRLRMRVEPRAEWAEIFRETWRIQRDYFYQASMHGANWPAIYAKYAPFVAHVNHRADLDYLIAMVGGELTVGHSAVNGKGDVPRAEPLLVGMLGADYAVDQGHYRIQRIYTGDRWNRAAQAPLAAPGVEVKEGEYLLEVNGRAVTPSCEIYAYFEGTAGKPTQLRIGPSPAAADSRIVTVVPIADEEILRTDEDWIEKNRRRVEQLSGGRMGYVWLSNTGPQGYQAFNRQFFAQLDKTGMILDVRYNQGGFIDDYIVDTLTRTQFGWMAMRDGAVAPVPIDTVYGPKVLLMNESAGSGGDALPHYFRLRSAGPLVGTRTWGGLVGPTAEPPPQTLDGGSISAPSAGFYDAHGRWLIENEGVAPDIEVENTASAVIAGRDPQLERAVEEGMRLLEGKPVQPVPRPAPPDRVSRSASH